MINKPVINIWSPIVSGLLRATHLFSAVSGRSASLLRMLWRCSTWNGIHSTPMRKTHPGGISHLKISKHQQRWRANIWKWDRQYSHERIFEAGIIKLNASLGTTRREAGWVGGWENEMVGAVTSVFLDTQCLARLLPGRHLTRKCHQVCLPVTQWMPRWLHNTTRLLPLRWVRISVTLQLLTGLFLPPVDGVCGMVWTHEKGFLFAFVVGAENQSTLVNSQTKGAKVSVLENGKIALSPPPPSLVSLHC